MRDIDPLLSCHGSARLLAPPSTARISVFCVAFSHEVCPLPENKVKLWTRTPPAARRPTPPRDFSFTDPMTRIIQDETPRENK